MTVVCYCGTVWCTDDGRRAGTCPNCGEPVELVTRLDAQALERLEQLIEPEAQPNS